MEFRTPNRPRQAATATTKSVSEPQPQPPSRISWHGRRPWIGLIIILALFLISAMCMFFWRTVPSAAEQAIKRDKFQAVFLTNNQVYFGRLSKVDDRYLVMTNVYYLQVQQAVQPQKDDSNTSQTQQASLSKLGSEIHGPEDTMHISRDQVLFWENLKDDSQVVKAIQEQQK